MCRLVVTAATATVAGCKIFASDFAHSRVVEGATGRPDAHGCGFPPRSQRLSAQKLSLKKPLDPPTTANPRRESPSCNEAPRLLSGRTSLNVRRTSQSFRAATQHPDINQAVYSGRPLDPRTETPPDDTGRALPQGNCGNTLTLGFRDRTSVTLRRNPSLRANETSGPQRGTNLQRSTSLRVKETSATPRGGQVRVNTSDACLLRQRLRTDYGAVPSCDILPYDNIGVTVRENDRLRNKVEGFSKDMSDAEVGRKFMGQQLVDRRETALELLLDLDQHTAALENTLQLVLDTEYLQSEVQSLYAWCAKEEQRLTAALRRDIKNTPGSRVFDSVWARDCARVTAISQQYIALMVLHDKTEEQLRAYPWWSLDVSLRQALSLVVAPAIRGPDKKVMQVIGRAVMTWRKEDQKAKDPQIVAREFFAQLECVEAFLSKKGSGKKTLAPKKAGEALCVEPKGSEWRGVLNLLLEASQELSGRANALFLSDKEYLNKSGLTLLLGWCDKFEETMIKEIMEIEVPTLRSCYSEVVKSMESAAAALWRDKSEWLEDGRWKELQGIRRAIAKLLRV